MADISPLLRFERSRQRFGVPPDKLLWFAESPKGLSTGVPGRSRQMVKEASLSRSKFSIFLWRNLKLGPVPGLPSSLVHEVNSADMVSEDFRRKRSGWGSVTSEDWSRIKENRGKEATEPHYKFTSRRNGLCRFSPLRVEVTASEQNNSHRS